MPETRKLAAILAADVAGYSRLAAEARDTLKHYLSRNDSKMKTISAVNAQASSQSFSPLTDAFVKRVSEGLRRVGMPEE